MSIRAVQSRADPSQPLSAGDRDLSRVLSLMGGGQNGALTIAALRERGIEAPALTVYELQLAGYEIERSTRIRMDTPRRAIDWLRRRRPPPNRPSS